MRVQFTCATCRTVLALLAAVGTAMVFAPPCGADGRARETPPHETPAAGVVIYPVDGQKGVPVAFPGHEVPDPIPEAHGGVAGFPITATFPRSVAVRKARATLLDPDGREVEAWASSPEAPADPHRPDAQQNTICIIAKKPLAPDRAYTVRLSAEAGGKDWSRAWSFTTAGEEEAAEGAVKAFLQRLNAHRKAAGLDPVSADADLSAPCTAHARYLERNFDEKDLNWNDEDATLPGASDEGRRVARRALVDAGGGAESSADWCVASFIAREMVLDAAVRKLGVGAAPHAAGGFVWVIDAQSGRGERGPAEAVLFPGPDQKGVPTAYPSGEAPPIPDADAKAPCGYAVTALFPPRTAIADVEARLLDEAGKEVESYVSTPKDPAIRGVPQHGIGLVPKSVLRPGAKYTVVTSAKVGGEAWTRTWDFHTAGDSDDDEAAFAAAAVESLNAYRRTAGLAPVTLDEERSKGCRLHANYLARNIDQPAAQGLGMHDEDASLPGATAEGRRAGRASVVAREPDAGAAVDGWIDTLFHRAPLLNPDLKAVGYACVRLPDRGYVCVMDAEPGK